MITTTPEFSADIMEVIKLFTSSEIDFKHSFIMDGEYINEIEICGKSYVYHNALLPYNDSLEEKRYKKRYIKLAVYKAFSEYFHKEMPWGALTGIRPTKLAYQEIEKIGSFSEYFTSVMQVSKEKTKLIERILAVQSGIYEKNDLNTDFFVGIPFCPSKCKYCSFISSDITKSGKFITQYVDGLIKEITESKKLIRNLRSVYIGGGTPVALPLNELERILKAIGKVSVEYTVEAGRPDCITAENLKLLKDYGVTRICVNPQTFNDDTLVRLGRRHTAQDIYDKYALAKGQFIINMDFIAGLEGETFEDFKYNIDKAIELSPENITVHTLCLKKGSALKEEVSRLSEGEIEKMVSYAHEKLFGAGYNPYYLYRQKYMAGNLENTGYAKRGAECVYNIDIMEEISQNIACGANAVSKVVYNGGERIERYASPKDIMTYINKIDEIIREKTKLFE